MGSRSINWISFFKPLVNDFTNKLILPPYFVDKHNDILHDVVKLRTSSGEMWEVTIEQTEDGKHCFTKGWNKFVKDLYLLEREYVVFFLDSDGYTYDVTVFSENCYEKRRVVRDLPVELERSDDLSSDDSVKVHAKCRKGKGLVISKSRRPNLNKETSKVYQMAKEKFKSGNPFHISLIHPSGVSHKSISFWITHSFAMPNLREDCNNLTLRVGGERTWSVRCKLSSRGVNLSTGWKKFVMDNTLKAGDACVFEVINMDKGLWNVTIFPPR